MKFKEWKKSLTPLFCFNGGIASVIRISDNAIFNIHDYVSVDTEFCVCIVTWFYADRVHVKVMQDGDFVKISIKRLLKKIKIKK